MSPPTFGQRMGVEPLPPQLQPKEVSDELASHIWATVYDSMLLYKDDRDYGPDLLGGPWLSILKAHHVFICHYPLDEFSLEFLKQKDIVKRIIYSGDYLVFYNFVDFLLQDVDCPSSVAERIALSLELSRAPYRVIENMIVPIGSEEEAMAIESALQVAAAHPSEGPKSHLRSAVAHLTGGRWPDAIRESIHAVESAAKIVEPSAKDLGAALTKLEQSGAINQALKKAFGSLYGFASDEKGIRHALVYEGRANVSEADAMFMFGACAAFVSYLLSPRS